MKRQALHIIVSGILFITVIAGCSQEDPAKGGSSIVDTGGTPGPANPVDPGDPGTPGSPGAALGFIVTSDFSVGNFATITTTTPRTTQKDVLGATGVHSDAAIRAFGNLVFILQRLGANSILVIDPDNPSAPIANYTTNDAANPSLQSNPVDIAFVSMDKAYISRYELNTLLIVNPRTGAQLGTIDLSGFADSDDKVEMDQMVLIGNRLFVSLQRLNRNNFFSADNTSYIVVIDTETNAIIEASPGLERIDLQGRNPFDMAYLASIDRIVIANVSNFSTGDAFGGIEIVNPNTGLSEGIVLLDDDFNGPLSAIAIASDTIAYASFFDPSFNNDVVPFNLAAKQVGPALSGLGAGATGGLTFDKAGLLYIADRDTNNPGVQVYDPATNQKIEGPIDTGLPPNEIVFLP